VVTPRATRYRARHARAATLPRATGIAGLATATTLAFLPPSAATAEPTAAAELERRISALDTQAALAVEDFRVAQAALEDVERRAAAARERAAAERERLAQARAAMSDLVAAAYRRGSAGRLASLMTDGDPTTWLERASTLDRIARGQAEVLADVATARHRLEAQEAAAERELQARRAAERDLAARTAAVEKTVARQQELLAGLQAQERQRVEAARLAAAPAPASRASRSASARTAPAGTAPAGAPATYSGPASGRAKAALDEGYRQLGKPYRYGGNGPDSFDCSGFTSWAWRAAGVSLPRTSRDQYAQGRKVARADIQPGDLVYFGSPISHVGMYVGDGQMINAPQSGGVVRVQPAFRSDFVGATRP
jgi:cell wall-associated NlpC family hydrolase